MEEDYDSNRFEIICIFTEDNKYDNSANPIKRTTGTNFTKICRTCMEESTKMISVLKITTLEGQEINLADLLSECVSVQISSEDTLPLNICNSCLEKLIEIHSFRKQVCNVQNLLNSKIESLDTTGSHDLETIVQTVHLQRHNKTTCEKKENPYSLVCKFCSAAYEHKNKLKNHVNKFHSNEVSDASPKVQPKPHKSISKFLCNNCGKTCSTKANLNTHIKAIHTREKPHKCTSCFKSFSDLSGLKKHVLIHSESRPFKCDLCFKSFRQSTHLVRHNLTHTKERPHSCGYCGRSFAQKVNLIVHERKHTGETPHVCKECGKGFYSSSNLKKHTIKQHPTENF